MRKRTMNKVLAALMSFVMMFSIVAQVDVVKAAEIYEGVVAHYDMTVEDDKLVDISGNGNDASMVGLSESNVVTEDDGSKALQFNGSGYVKIPDVLDGNAATFQLVYQIGSRTNEGLLTMGTRNASTSGNYYFRFHPNASTNTYLLESIIESGEAKVSGNYPYATNEYVTVTIVISEDGNYSYFLNGKKGGTVDMKGVTLQQLLDTCDNRADAIGFLGRPAWANHDPYFSGKLKSVEIYNYEVPEEEILWNNRTGLSPVAEYDMSLTEDGKLADKSGFGFDATLVGLDESNFVTDAGKKVLDFGKSGGYVELPAGVVQGNEITIQATFKMGEENSSLWTLGTKRDQGTYARLNPATSKGLLFEAIAGWNGPTTEVAKEKAPIAGGDYVTVTTVLYESGVSVVYLGSEEIARAENTPNVQDILKEAVDSESVIGWIGRPIWSNDPGFSGKLERFTVYERALTSDDIFMSTLEYETTASSTRIVSNVEPKDVQGSYADIEWRESMVSGNGNNGLLHAGYPYNDTLTYQNINLLMPSTQTRENPDYYWQLETVRQAVINGDEGAIPQIGRTFFYAYHPGAKMRLQLDKSITNNGEYTNYERWADYETAEVGVTYANNLGLWERTSFTSREDDVTITKIEQSSTGTKVNMEISIDNVSTFPGFSGDPTNMQYKKLVSDDADYITFVGKYPGTGGYAGGELKDGGYATVSKIIVVGGTKEKVLNTTTSRDSQNVGTENDPRIKITDADAVYIISRTDRTWDMCTYNQFKAKEQYDLVDSLMAELDAVEEKYDDGDGFSYEAAFAPHAESFREEFNKVKFSLNADEEDIKTSVEGLFAKQKSATGGMLYDAMVERAYNAGRYAELCCAGYTAPRLSGMWTGQFNGGWRYIYTLDANVNLQVAPMNTGHMESAALGYINFILKLSDDFMENAYLSYRMHDAIQPSVNSDGDSAIGVESDWQYPFAYWNAGGSWLMLPIYEYWQCYGNQQIKITEEMHLEDIQHVLGVEDGGLSDAEFEALLEKGYLDLEKDILLPLLTKMANFWEQIVTPEYYMDADGNPHYEKGKTELDVEAGEKYMITPSYSPENAPREDGGYTWNQATTMNATMDIAAARDGLDMVMHMEEVVGRDGYEEAIEKWSTLKSLLPEYQYDGEPGSEETYYGGGGAIREWAAPIYMEENRHRHISHMYVAWPSYETKQDEKVAAGASQAMKNRERIVTADQKTQGHGLMHNALVYSRLGESENVYHSLYNVLNSNIYYSSMVTDHNTDRGSNTYCTDTGISLVAVINEALVFSNTGEIELLPALPGEWENGSIDGLMARTQAEIVSLAWDQEAGTTDAVIQFNAAQEVELSCGQVWTDVQVDGAEVLEKVSGEAVKLKVNEGDKVTVKFTMDPVLGKLLKAVEAEELANLDKDYYTADTWAVYEKALADAKALLNEDDVKEDAVDAAVKALADAKAGLVEYVVDLPDVVADFDFDEDGEAFDGGYAQAKGTYTLVDHGDGKAIKLDGNNQFLTLTAKDGKSLIADTDELTVAFQINPESSATNWGFFAAPNASAQTYLSEKYIGVFDNKGSIAAERYNSNNEARPAQPSWNAGYGNWYHVAAVFSESETVLYVDGKEVARETSSVDLSELLGKKSVAYIGKSTWESGEYYKGLLDNFKIFSRALTAEEIIEVYKGDNAQPQPKLPYNDVAKGEWYYDSIAYNYAAGTMTGKNETTFAPNASLKRAEFASIIHRMEGEEAVDFTSEFPDVLEGDWYAAPVLWAKANKIVSGYGDGTFGPNNNINREQIAVMMHNYATAKGYDVSATNDLFAYSDAGIVSEYALPAMKWAVGAGIISGKGGTQLAPHAETTRAECAAIIMNFMEKYA